jgi:hypothetical protein
MLQFFVLSGMFADGADVNSVFVNLHTLMSYWGHALRNHDDMQCVEIKQEFVTSYRDLDTVESIIEMQVWDNESSRYVRYYFRDIKDAYMWGETEAETKGMHPEYRGYDMDLVTVKSLTVNRE